MCSAELSEKSKENDLTEINSERKNAEDWFSIKMSSGIRILVPDQLCYQDFHLLEIISKYLKSKFDFIVL